VRALASVKPSVLAYFPEFTTLLEGDIPHFYLDKDGWMTIKQGCLVDPVHMARGLPMVHRVTGRLATPDEIEAEWTRIKARKELAIKGWQAATPLCDLRLTQAGGYALVMERLEATVKELLKQFPDFATWPAGAQLAVISRCWAAGTESPYPRMDAALRARDFRTAAKEATTRGNPKRTKAQHDLLMEAAEVEESGTCDPGLKYRYDERHST
jgi:hypothetical protein